MVHFLSFFLFKKKIFESAGDLGVPKIVKPELTVPVSPAIHKSRPRSAKVTAPPPPPPPAPPKRIIPVSYTKKPQPVIEHRKIVPVDFRLPGEEISARKKEIIAEQRKKEEQQTQQIRKCKANPLPDDLPDVSFQFNIIIEIKDRAITYFSLFLGPNYNNS